MTWLSELKFTQQGQHAIPNRPLEGRAVAVLGGGPSLTRRIAEALQAGPVIAANNAFYLVRQPALVVALDRRWFEWHGNALAAFGHLAVTALRAGGSIPYRGKYYAMHREREAVWPPNAGTMAGKNSGHAAAALAFTLGATRVYLAGFDMGFPEGRHHWHDEHPVPSSEANYTTRFRPDLEKLARIADQRGLRLASVTPTMADIPCIPLHDALKDLAA